MIRVDKIFSELGISTRNETKKLIRQNRIVLNGAVLKDPSVKIDPEIDILFLDHQQIIYSVYVYYMLNKPQGYISATLGTDPLVIELIDDHRRNLFPVGRLDKDTEGLLLITNDGALSHDLLSPRHHVEKEYYVETRDKIHEDLVGLFSAGLRIDGNEVCLPASLKLLSERSCTLVIEEGKYHQVKRMFQAAGNEVIYLKRIRMKNLWLDESLSPGEYRPLTETEIQGLYSSPKE